MMIIIMQKSQGKLHVHVKGKKKWNMETTPNIKSYCRC